jgi:phosphate transport system permease protein
MFDTTRLILYRKRQDAIFSVIGVICTFVGIITLVVLFADLAIDGLPHLNWHFVTSYPSRRAASAGILSPLAGTFCLMLVTFFTAVPLGIGAAVYLEEYASKNWLTTIIELNISNLAGVPSIIYGLMALGILGLFSWLDKLHLFPFRTALDRCILVGGVTLALLVLPIIIVTTREAIRAIPKAIREAAYACGATKWQVIRYHLLPYALGGIATGTIIAMSRAIGETAPLITIGALTYVAFLPPAPVQSAPPFVNADWLFSRFTALPIQMYNWVSRPQDEFHKIAATTGLVLIAFTLSMNAAAMWVRYQMRKKIKW